MDIGMMCQLAEFIEKCYLPQKYLHYIASFSDLTGIKWVEWKKRRERREEEDEQE
jgi:hypothetical protein